MPSEDSSDDDDDAGDDGDVAGGVGGRRGVVVGVVPSPPWEGRGFEEADDSLAEDSNTLPNMLHRKQMDREKIGTKMWACRLTAGRHFLFFLLKIKVPNVDDAANEHSALVALPCTQRGYGTAESKGCNSG